MRAIAITALILTAVLPSAQANPACESIVGVERLWTKPDVHYVLFGELHGTAEMPKAFGEAVCAALARGKSVAVGLEFPESLQPALDAFIVSTGSDGDRAKFLSERYWQVGKDGRTSVAMLGLVERLRGLRQSGAPVRVFAFQPVLRDPADYDPARYEATMAEQVLSAAQRSESDVVMALVGNMHAHTSQDLGYRQVPYALMAMHMPRSKIVTVMMASQNGGTAWTCIDATDCGPHPAGRETSVPTLGLTFFDASRNGYDGVLVVPQTTASPPAAAK